MATAPELLDRTLWLAASDQRRHELTHLLAAQLAPESTTGSRPEFQFAGMQTYAGTEQPIAVFTHNPTALEFSLIPGGSFDMGLSPEEERTIRQARARFNEDPEEFVEEFDLLLSEIGHMRPLHRVVVPPFLIAQRVLLVGDVRRWLANFRDPLYGDVDAAPAHLTPEQIATVLAATGLRLPSEAELEYAARGGLERCLLPTGDRIPDENTLEAMIADDDGATRNAFGIHGYGLSPELCADHWHEHYQGAPADGSPRLGSGLCVIRGGAADRFPWQDCGEWNMLLCAFRMNDHAAECGAALRLVTGLLPLASPARKPAHKQPARKQPASKKPARKQPARKRV